MRRRLVASSSLAVLLVASPGLARTVCVQDSFTNVLVFQKAKAPKKPGATALLQGFYVAAGSSFPLSGSAVARANGEVVFGATVHAMLGGTDFDYSMTMVGDATFAASGYYDTNSDGDVDTSQGWSVVDCRGVAIP